MPQDLIIANHDYGGVLTMVCRTTVSKWLYLKMSILMAKEILIRFGNKVREERTKLGISQEELAARAGVHRTYIGMIERAEKNLTLANIDKVCKALGLNIRDFFSGF